MIRRARGFTLIEMMVVVAIIAIITAAVLPMFEHYLQEGRRADAMAVLSSDQQILNSCYAQTYSYTSSSCAPIATTSPEGFYTVQPTLSAQAYTLVATPVGDQVNDTTCAQFSVDNTGTRAAQSAGGTDTTATCW